MNIHQGHEQGRILLAGNGEGRAVASTLEAGGHHVSHVRDGHQALLLLKEGDFDLVLLDAALPGLDGFELLQRIRHDSGLLQLPVIMLTGPGDAPSLPRAFELGANDVLSHSLDGEEMLARVRMQLHLRALTQLKTSFLSIASHDLKKPVMLIRDIAETLLDELKEGTPLGVDDLEALQLVVRSSHYMSDIIQDFLDLQALEDGRLNINIDLVDINALLRRRMEGSLRAAQKKNIALSCSLDEALPEVRCDPVRIAQVFENLVGNAIKFCSGGDSVTVHSLQSDGRLRVEVRDSGPGVPLEERHRLFTSHARLSPRPTGGEQSTGFGLAICRQLIEMHGGRIGADSNPGGGMVFWFELPL